MTRVSGLVCFQPRSREHKPSTTTGQSVYIYAHSPALALLLNLRPTGRVRKAPDYGASSRRRAQAFQGRAATERDRARGEPGEGDGSAPGRGLPAQGGNIRPETQPEVCFVWGSLRSWVRETSRPPPSSIRWPRRYGMPIEHPATTPSHSCNILPFLTSIRAVNSPWGL